MLYTYYKGTYYHYICIRQHLWRYIFFVFLQTSYNYLKLRFDLTTQIAF